MEDKSFRATLSGYVLDMRRQLKRGDDPDIILTHYEPLLVSDACETADKDLIEHESGMLVSQAEYLYSVTINKYAGESIRLSTMVCEIERILATSLNPK